MIKTLHLTNAYHSQSGGIRTFYQAMLAAAAENGRYLRLVVPAERTAVEEVNPFARIYHLRAPRSPWIDRRYRLLLPHRFLFGVRGPLWRILRAEQPDLIEVCDKYALCHLGGLIRHGWLTRTPRPAVVGLTCEPMDDNIGAFLSTGRMATRFAGWYMRHVYVPQFDGHIAVSRYAAAEIDFGLRPVHTCAMGLDVTRFSMAHRSREARLASYGAEAGDPRTVVLVYVGRLSAEKNLTLLLDLIAQLDTGGDRVYHLWMIGEGPLRPRLIEEGQCRAPGRVHLLGHIADREALATLYANADLLVHPNGREPLGLAPLEAMASGLPVVVPNTGGVREYATSENAWLADPTPDAFAQAVRAALDNRDLTAAKAARARITAEAHDWEPVTRRYFALYDEIWRRSERNRHIGNDRQTGAPSQPTLADHVREIVFAQRCDGTNTTQSAAAHRSPHRAAAPGAG